MTNPTCSTCRWHNRDDIECRRHAPRVIIEQAAFNNLTYERRKEDKLFPRMYGNGWCGDHMLNQAEIDKLNARGPQLMSIEDHNALMNRLMEKETP